MFRRVLFRSEVINSLKQHIFNWIIWPDFNEIPSIDHPFLCYNEISVGQTVQIAQKWITALPANHVVPAMGYQIDSGTNSLVFTGDTAACPEFWAVINLISNLKVLIIETAFSNAEAQLALLSKHLCPATLAQQLGFLTSQPAIYITHLKPGENVTIMQEIAAHPLTRQCRALLQQQIFTL